MPKKHTFCLVFLLETVSSRSYIQYHFDVVNVGPPNVIFVSSDKKFSVTFLRFSALATLSMFNLYVGLGRSVNKRFTQRLHGSKQSAFWEHHCDGNQWLTRCRARDGGKHFDCSERYPDSLWSSQRGDHIIIIILSHECDFFSLINSSHMYMWAKKE